VNHSIWQLESLDRSASMRGTYRADVVVIGAGIAGITSALILREAGKSVILLDKGEPAHGESYLTTAHITQILDTRYTDLLHEYGREKTRLICAAARRGSEIIADRVNKESLHCDFEEVPGYLYSEFGQLNQATIGDLQKESECARQLDIPNRFVDEVPLPFSTLGAIEFSAQYQFHPQKYLHGLLKLFIARGGLVFGGCKISNMVHGEPCEVYTENAKVVAKNVVVCTNDPISHPGFMHTKIAAYRSYAIAVKPKEFPGPGLFWDTAEPCHYTRSHTTPSGQVLIIGGEDHKTGLDTHADERFKRLYQFAEERFGISHKVAKWSGQIIETIDDLPYIGHDGSHPHFHIATGFSGNGMNLGSLAAEMISQTILGPPSVFADLFRPNRLRPSISAGTYLSENKDFPVCFLKDRLADPIPLEDLPPGEGAIVKTGGKRVAAYKTPAGEVRGLSAVCTHLGCYVRWNSAEKTWDCPCHGSRFDVEGKVLNGPAVEGLRPVFVDDQIEKIAFKRDAWN
jgi:glycine/D-amino acid oxidase-like deaminating enzyme/nitrite reductase/ring-hydroxylating ferredoxin subunit